MATEMAKIPMPRPIPKPGNGFTNSAAPAVAAPAKTFALINPPAVVGHRVGIYGPGGSGKTTLATLAPGPVAVVDADDSLAVLGAQVKVVPVNNYGDLRLALRAPIWDGIRTIVLDSATAIEEWVIAWTLANVPHEKGHSIKRIEDYGFGKGLQHIYDSFMPLLADLDTHVKAGRNVVLVMHDCTTTVPNPTGDDYLRYEPRLQSPNSGKNSIRLRVREWLDHLIFIGYDIAAKDKKATGSGSRTFWPTEQAHCMAKSRRIADSMEYVQGDDTLWRALMPEQYPASDAE
ncbi:MAG: ATP-binding protein [Bryobacteraceae bacterium]